MNIFFTLVSKIIPLYGIIFLGFIGGKYLKVQKESIAKLLIYVIAPIVIFNSVVTTELSMSVLTLPLLFFLICSFFCLFAFHLGNRTWKDTTKNIFAYASATGNSGYFGLPVAIVLFGPRISGLVLICTLGFILFENSVGFYVTARGHHSMKESIEKVLKLPTLYAFVFAILLNVFGLKVGQQITDVALLFRGAYTVLGMMLIGMGFSSILKFTIDTKFLGFLFLMKFIAWPLIIGIIISIDSNFFHLFTIEMYQVMILMSVVPLAANTVAFATELKTEPDKASIAVLLSTLFALFYIPLIAFIFFTS